MIRALVLSLGLMAPGFALACDGHDCGGTCSMAAKEAADADSSALADADGTKVTLEVHGLTCGGSAMAVRTALSIQEGVNAVAVHLERGEAEASFDAEKTDAESLAQALTEAGFEATVQQ